MRYIAPTAEVREQFHQGLNNRAYEMLGAHPVEQDGVEMWHFAVWAPNAKAVSLVGEFCGWDRTAYPMVKQFDGTWEIRVPAINFKVSSNRKKYSYKNAKEKLLAYKYAVCQADGNWVDKTDPYAFAIQLRPNTASKLYDFGNYRWHDSKWMKARAKWDPYTSPINIYEVHLGSWKREGSKKDGLGGAGSDGAEEDAGRYLTYLEMAEQLIPYVKEMGYTHIELLPVMEHPLDMSWGYQVSGYFAATSRYGEPRDLMKFIDACHQNGIGVFLDWVPAHFPKDAAGLRRFDGTCCYEHPDPQRGEMPSWGTCMFDYARGEVRSFMMSSATFWLDVFHADGIRVDAVSSMVYHDFCREPGQWTPNRFGGRENLDAISFLQMLNKRCNQEFPGVLMMAEESHAFPGVTKPAEQGGLNFNFKWNMGWMNDMLAYVEKDPVYRKWHHDKLTFSLFYAFSENFILPFSHDEVVHGKHSMLDKHPGDLWKKFAGLRALYGYTMAHPGKKLLFMGSEFGQVIEWKYADQLDWFLLLYDKHPQLQKCVKDLNHIYTDTPALYQVDGGWDGFQWLQANDNDHSIVAFTRTDKDGNTIAAVTNFTPVFHQQYTLGLPNNGTLTEFFNTDKTEYGGSNQYNAAPCEAKKEQYGEFKYRTTICVPSLATVYFRYDKLPEPVEETIDAVEEPAAAAEADKAEA
ncbi:MAG: 1,4-alpha-glucan branching protein GlgB [Clostridia bacterium]|nr:1,4-alpha-glucan branching protein GlgB [Clostridia bacterium]